MDLGGDLTLASLSSVPPACERKENANERRETGETKDMVW